MKHKAPKLNPSILDEATEWFVDFSQGDVDTSGRERFNAWLRRSPEHVRAYLQITAVWADAGLLEKGRTLGSEQLVDQAMRETNVVPLVSGAAPAEARSEGEARREAPPAPRRTNLLPLAFAASLIVALAGAWLYMQRETFATSIGEQRSITLTDGSTVDLNSRSRVRVRYTDNERAVELLEGQALFRVAKDRTRPFIVRANGTRVRAVGTQFDVYRKINETIVTVVEGRVAILPLPDLRARGFAPGRERRGDQQQPRRTPDLVEGDNSEVGHADSAAVSKMDAASRAGRIGTAILLGAGEQITVAPTVVATPKAADISAATAWTRREIVFQATPLSEVIEEFNRYNGRQLTIMDTSLKDVRISGVFSSTDPDSLLRFLEELPSIRVDERHSQIQISSE